MASQNVDDCYFYYYSSCTKGDECPYRHCKLALGTETVCSLWREGRCFRGNCKFRHMESQINRSAIPCYWENQPGGCRKPHCVFLHRKLRNGVPVDPRMILPVSNGKPSPLLPDSLDRNSPVIAQSPSSPGLNKESVSDPASVPVPRLVLSFDEAEESDTESVSSTPNKGPSDDSKGLHADSAKKNLGIKLSAATKEKDFGIKTLEQIRMEKIHKESNHYYSGYDAPSLESPHVECYPPKSDFISISASPSLDKSLPTLNADTTRQSLDIESDLRGRLFKRQKAVVDKGVNLRQQQSKKITEESPKNLNFKIKTLDEIRRERENKRGLQPSNADANSSSGDDKPAINESQKSAKRLKITRKSKELYASAATVNATDEEKSMLVSVTTQEKRKSGLSALERQRKFMKVDSNPEPTLNGSVPQEVAKEKKILTNLGSFLRRPKTKVTSPSTTLQPPHSHADKSDDNVLSSNHDNPSTNITEPTSILLPPTISPATVPSTKDSVSTSPAKSTLHTSKQEENDVFLPTSNKLTSEDSVCHISTTDCDMSTEGRVGTLPTNADDMPTTCGSPSNDAEMTGNDIPSNENSVMPTTTEVNVRKLSQESMVLDDAKEDVSFYRSASVDEFDSYLNESDMNAEDGEDCADGDDILAEVEQFLDS